MIIQARHITLTDIQLIKRLIKENPSWNRTRLSKKICTIWDWKTSNGQYKDIACRSLLRKLEKLEYFTLPKPIHSGSNRFKNRCAQYILHETTPIKVELKELLPIEIKIVQDSEEKYQFDTFLSLYHYLGFNRSVGENLKYLAFDKEGRALACFLYGSAAWKTAPRDSFLGWDSEARKKNLHLLTNNHRFLILPWVFVKHLGSYLLGRMAKRISADWEEKYGHRIYLLETFVERGLYAGTCYKASNWIWVGQTKGRTRNDVYHDIQKPIKDIYLYPLVKDFRKRLAIET